MQSVILKPMRCDKSVESDVKTFFRYLNLELK